MTRSITSLTLRLSPYHESYNTLNILPTNGQIQGHLTKRQEMCKKHKYCDRFSPILKIEFAPILNNQEQWWGRGGETRSGTEKRCSHNLQSVQLAWWSADNCSIFSQ